jgi:glycosyltransferase involved in cell wall biosynthesis
VDAPLLSILLPVYDAAATLPACLRSIERQTESRWCCVVVDDGSTDESAEVVHSFVTRDDRFRLLSASHRGLVDALLLGVSECTGDYVVRMDADDVMRRERLSLQLAALESDPSLAAVGCHVRIFPRLGLTDGMVRYESWLNDIRGPADVRRDAYVECPVAHPTLMIRREVLQSVNYRDRGWPEDYDLVLRLLGAGHRVGMVPRRLLAWRDSADRLSRVHERYALERFTACKASALATDFLGGAEQYVLWGYGDTGKALRSALASHGCLPSHIVELHPGRVGNHIQGALVVSPDALTELMPRKVIVSVAGLDARTRIRRVLEGLGLKELRDFVVAA